MGHIHPAFDSFSHFRVHLAVILAILFIAACLARRWNTALVSLPFLSVSTALTAPHLPGSGPTSSLASERTIEILQFNLLFSNPDLAKAHSLLAQTEADFVLLQEASPRTRGVLETLRAKHPYQIYCEQIGVAVTSKHPFAPKVEQKCSPGWGFAAAQYLVNGQAIQVASVHLSWPWPKNQSRQVDRLAPHFRQLRQPLIVAGDFNAAPWSNTVTRIVRLTDGVVASGYQPSWGPRDLGTLRKYVGLPIDNTIHSKNLEVISRRTLADAGSDHLPILTRIRLTGE